MLFLNTACGSTRAFSRLFLFFNLHVAMKVYKLGLGCFRRQRLQFAIALQACIGTLLPESHNTTSKIILFALIQCSVRT